MERKKKKKKEPYATDVSALDRKEGNISATMVQKWQEGVLSTRKLMVVRTSYSGMQESVHNKTVDPATSFSFHCPSYQYPIFTGMHKFPYFLLSYNYNRKSKFFSLFILPFFFNVTFIKLLLPLFFVSIYLQLQSKVKILLILYSSYFLFQCYIY